MIRFFLVQFSQDVFCFQTLQPEKEPTGQASNMYFVPKDVPLSSRDTTVTTTIEEIEEEIETTEEAMFFGAPIRGRGLEPKWWTQLCLGR